MSRLATRIKDHPRRGTGISPRTRTNPTFSSTRLDPAALMPKGGGWTIPRLILPDGRPVPTEFRLVEGERAARDEASKKHKTVGNGGKKPEPQPLNLFDTPAEEGD